MPPAPSGEVPVRLTLAARTAEQLMTPHVVSVPADAPVGQAVALLTDRGLSAAPAIDEAGRPLGVLSQADVLVHLRQLLGPAAAPAAATQARVRDLMTPTVFSVTPRTPAPEVVRMLLALKVRRLFVVDDAGVPVGVISAADVLRHLTEEPAPGAGPG
jgi:CBS domain-containing protein